MSDHARALAEQTDRHAVTLESLLAILRSTRLDDRAARQTAIEVAGSALVALRSSEDERHQELLESVADAFAHLKAELRPLVRFGELDVQYVDPPVNGRALPGDVAQAARAIVRNAVLAIENVAALDGEMAVSSTPGWGTDIGITIPLDLAPAPSPLEDAAELTDRERDVLRHLALGARNAEIAHAMGISTHTVKFYVSKLLRKAGARNRAELAALMR
jgi:DNA-binding CsgD family transcriptional regulator